MHLVANHFKFSFRKINFINGKPTKESWYSIHPEEFNTINWKSKKNKIIQDLLSRLKIMYMKILKMQMDGI